MLRAMYNPQALANSSETGKEEVFIRYETFQMSIYIEEMSPNLLTEGSTSASNGTLFHMISETPSTVNSAVELQSAIDEVTVSFGGAHPTFVC